MAKEPCKRDNILPKRPMILRKGKRKRKRDGKKERKGEKKRVGERNLRESAKLVFLRAVAC